ncbi:MAG: hypothetical protein EHM45_19365 [Desulfobacteraceae bacterium]|nr:MAG: hypothetical protein EHM45_19365 [Desulfobacteraceae bacterium]
MYNPIYPAILVPIIWAFTDFLAKILINQYGSKRAVLLVQVSATLCTVLLVLFIQPPFPQLSSAFLISIIGSATLSALAWIFFFKGLEGRLSITEPIAYTWTVSKLGAALPAAISSISPAIVVLLSYFLLKERLNRMQI